MTDLHITAKVQERAVLVGVITPNETAEQEKESLDELAFLAETAGAITIKTFTQRLPHPDKKTFVGSGKLEEIVSYVKASGAGMVIFDDELGSSQLRNLGKEFGDIKIVDRSNLILDIFADRAQTAQAKIQVELAQYQYMLPRLTNMWTHLERQKGGIGMRGPGESQIETDRRIVLDKISLLKDRLEKIDTQSAVQRKNRKELVRVALVGYTNAGKSTLMNAISKSEVFAENKLFATLDTTVRKIVIENLPLLLSDTVGFIRKLPHHLVECFKSTLAEVCEADILVHVVDISHPNFRDQIQTVNDTLKDLNADNKEMIMVFNKIDSYKPENNNDMSLEEFQSTWIAGYGNKSIFISAANKTNIEELKETIYTMGKEIHTSRFPHDNLLY
jgi:GTP-binding protein HflX